MSRPYCSANGHQVSRGALGKYGLGPPSSLMGPTFDDHPGLACLVLTRNHVTGASVVHQVKARLPLFDTYLNAKVKYPTVNVSGSPWRGGANLSATRLTGGPCPWERLYVYQTDHRGKAKDCESRMVWLAVL